MPQRWDWRLLAAQDQPPPKPTFKSAVDLVPVDVNVIDKSGRPVPHLAAGVKTPNRATPRSTSSASTRSAGATGTDTA